MRERKLAWRQLLTNPPTAWERLPLVVRGIGDEILRRLDATAEIDCGEENPEDVVLRLCGAHPRERKMVRSAFRALVAAEFLALIEVAGRRVIVGSLPDLSVAAMKRAQGTPAAPTLPQPPTQGVAKVDVTPPPTLPQPDAMFSPKPAETHKTASTEKRREEKNREEKTTTRAPAREASSSPLGEMEFLLASAHAALLRGYQERYERAAGDAWVGASKSFADIRACAAWVIAKGAPHIDERVRALLDGAFADEWLSGVESDGRPRRWPWGAIAKNPERYAAPKGPRTTRGRPSSAAVFLQAKPEAYGSGDFTDDDIPGEPEPQKVIGYG